MKWINDPAAEARMRDLGADFEVITIKASDIDQEKSRENQARILEPISEEIVLDYAIAMENGAEFPRPVVYRDRSTGKFVISSGNHRYSAAMTIGIKAIEVYLLKATDNYVIDMMTRCANRDLGSRQSREEAVEQVIYLARTYNQPIKDVARLFNLDAKFVAEHKRIKDLADQLATMGLNATLPKTTLKNLNKLSRDDRVVLEAARLFKARNVNTDQVKRIVDDIASRRSEDARLEQVNKWKAELSRQKVAPAKRDMGNRQKFLIAANSLGNLLEQFGTWELLHVTNKEDRQECRAVVRKLIERLSTLLAKVPQRRNGACKTDHARRPVV